VVQVTADIEEKERVATNISNKTSELLVNFQIE